MNQTKATVAVLVSESLQTTPDQIRYHLNIYPEEFLDRDRSNQGSVPAQQPLASPEEILVLARDTGGTAVGDALFRDFTIQQQFGRIPPTEVQLQFHSPENLRHFYDKLKDYPNITAAVVEVSSSRSVELEEQLWKKILQTGSAKAERLAANLSRKTGDILKVEELEEEQKEAGKWSAFPPGMMLAPNVIPHTSVRVTLRKKVRITFALE